MESLHLPNIEIRWIVELVDLGVKTLVSQQGMSLPPESFIRLATISAWCNNELNKTQDTNIKGEINARLDSDRRNSQ